MVIRWKGVFLLQWTSQKILELNFWLLIMLYIMWSSMWAPLYSHIKKEPKLKLCNVGNDKFFRAKFLKHYDNWNFI